ncbi:MAG: hypothetical protein HFH10_02635 [Dorea sp.]|nr:hypothetical protein [Dorea sp.]
MESIKFTKKELELCYRFAQRMKGNHNRDMIMDRTDWEIFRDDFRGKLGEIALRSYIVEKFPYAAIEGDIDFSVTPQGQWDITDLLVNGRYINVKSVKQRSNFLMIETKRYRENGEYSYQNNNGEDVRVDAYVLVRVFVEPDMNWETMNYLWTEQIIKNHCIYAEILGGISHEEFWEKKHTAYKGMKCTYHNLKAVCNGNGDNLPDRLNGGEMKNEILQQDNYILYKNELTCIYEFCTEMQID